MRRRRWIRLMMRPSGLQISRHHKFEGRGPPSISIRTMWHHQSAASSFSNIAKPLQHDTRRNNSDVNLGWLKEDVEGNWQKCCSLMKDLGQDGRKLELWKKWLIEARLAETDNGKAPHKELAGDIASDATDVSYARKLPTPSTEYLIPILHLRVCCEASELCDLLSSESRATRYCTLSYIQNLAPTSWICSKRQDFFMRWKPREVGCWRVAWTSGVMMTSINYTVHVFSCHPWK